MQCSSETWDKEWLLLPGGVTGRHLGFLTVAVQQYP